VLQRSKRFLLGTTIALGLATASVAPVRAASCADALNSTSELSKFAELVQASGLAVQLGTGTLTVFAPTNAALGRIATATQMLEGQSGQGQPDFPRLQTLVRAHLVAGAHPANEMDGQVTLTTLAGTSLTINGADQRDIVLSSSAPDGVNLSGMHLMPGVHVTGPAIACDNGVVYSISNALVQ
jgi:uncharacterized surface protein with fasciclin (FAS1) repeats